MSFRRQRSWLDFAWRDPRLEPRDFRAAYAIWSRSGADGKRATQPCPHVSGGRHIADEGRRRDQAFVGCWLSPHRGNAGRRPTERVSGFARRSAGETAACGSIAANGGTIRCPAGLREMLAASARRRRSRGRRGGRTLHPMASDHQADGLGPTSEGRRDHRARATARCRPEALFAYEDRVLRCWSDRG